MDNLVRLAVTLSARLTRARDTEIVPALVEALDEVVEATGVDACQLIEFSDTGAVAEVFASATSHAPADIGEASLPEDWLQELLARGEMVAIASPDDLPEEATLSRAASGRSGPSAILGVPAVGGEQVTCALVVQVTHGSRPWSQAFIERLHLLSDMFGAALNRRHHDSALRANVVTINKLNARLEADNVYLKEELKNYHDFDDIVGESAALRVALTRLGRVAPMNTSVLLIGPTGTGKELFARALHERSRRHARPLVRVNCAALPPTLVESELFGHEKGAFTGAVGLRQGRFELADGGTIFLDEIGDLSPDIQVKFLRVLQEGEFERVGSSRTRKVDVRVIAATHHDLEAAVAEGRFRADLYYRLSVYPIHLPSLKDRAEDIPRLVWFFINKHQRELARRITEVPKAVMDVLQRHSWPGNVRELDNVVERAMIASSGSVLQLDDPLAFNRPAAPRPEGESLDAVQRAHIEGILAQCGWRINGKGNAAERLGIHPNTLRFRLKRLDLLRPPTPVTRAFNG